MITMDKGITEDFSSPADKEFQEWWNQQIEERTKNMMELLNFNVEYALRHLIKNPIMGKITKGAIKDRNIKALVYDDIGMPIGLLQGNDIVKFKFDMYDRCSI